MPTPYETLVAERDALLRLHDELSERKSRVFAAYQQKAREVDAAVDADTRDFLNSPVFTGPAPEARLLQQRIG